MKVVKANNMSDRIILIKGKIELELPDGFSKFDIIISEWVSYCPFHESMLNTVLYAIDKWLALGGIILPDRTASYVSAIEGRQYKSGKLDLRDSVHGFGMSCIRNVALTKPLVNVADPNEVVLYNCR